MTAGHQPPRAPAWRARHRLAWASLIVLGLAACAGGPGPNPALGWSEAGSPKELEVERAEHRHAVHFATDSAAIGAAERDRLLAFLAAVEPKRGDRVRLEGHADERASDLYNLELASRRVESVADFLRSAGPRGLEIRGAAYGEKAPAAPGGAPEDWRANRRVEVVVERHVVVLPPCPDWSRRSGVDFANQPHTNLGCAVRSNLGLMIAEPRDLERGRRLAPADGTREADAITRYREGEVTPLIEEGTN